MGVQPVVPSSESDVDHTMGTLHLKSDGTGRMVDTNGEHWLKVGETDVCRSEFGTVAMDAKQGVFSLITYPKCEVTQDLPVCGTNAIEGCGAQPPPELRLDWYVKVPADAKLVQSPKESMAFSVPRCVILSPAGKLRERVFRDGYETCFQCNLGGGMLHASLWAVGFRPRN